jgi:hypothetical protein
MPGNRTEKTQIMPARAQRKRTWKAVSFGTTEDNISCLRGPMSGGAEKKKGAYPHGCSRGLFF